MRLLKVINSGFTLNPPVIPPPRYAILSHTWGDDEAKLQEIQNVVSPTPQFLARSGVRKITGAAGLAVMDGYSYLWVDTCCIDKENSTELSEAINSMFRWYAESEVCYVYLSDVPDEDAIHRPRSKFRESRWFTRGWTLQELLAPKEVRFYSMGWKFLGTKNDLKDVISSITKIPTDVLAGEESRPPNRSIGEILSWASSRKTLLEEDIAYSLLGILDINMPLIYGEGPKAFLRLQEELLKRHDDESIFAWEAPPSDARARPYFGLLSPSVTYFHSSYRFGHPRIETRYTEPISLTNKGISLQLPLIRSDQGTGIFFALLNCRIDESKESEVQPAIKVKRLGWKTYARLDVHHIYDFNFVNHIASDRDIWTGSSNSDKQMLFPYQPRPPLPVGGFAVQLSVQRQGITGRYTVLDCHPKERWKALGPSIIALLDVSNDSSKVLDWHIPETTVVGWLFVELFGKTLTLLVGLYKPDVQSSTGGVQERGAWWCIVNGNPTSFDGPSEIVLSELSSGSTSWLIFRVDENMDYRITASVRLEQMLGVVMYSVHFSESYMPRST
jgi:hypothetical protein